MKSNVDFLIAALVFLLVVMRHFLEHRRMDISSNRSFFVYIIIAVSDVVFDLLSTVLLESQNPSLVPLTQLCTLVFYVLQVTLPYMLVFHILSHYDGSDRARIRWRAIWAVVPCFMYALVLSNPWTGLLYQVTANGQYIHGPYYLWMYVYAMIYMLAAGIFGVVQRKRIGRRNAWAVVEVLLISGLCVLVQGVRNDLLTTGFGLALGVTVMFLTMNNPYLNTDGLTGVFDAKFLHERLRELMARKRNFHLIVVDLRQLRRVNLSFSTRVGDQLLMRTAEMLQAIDRRNMVFRTSGRRFLLMTEGIAEYETAIRRIREFYSRPMELTVGEMNCSVLISGVPHGERFDSATALIEYLNYLSSLAPVGMDVGVIQDNEETRRGFHYTQSVANYMETAMEQDAFDVYFQPIYSIAEDGYVEIEVLSRMYHPTLGPVSPEVFIRIAEKNDLITRFDVMQLRRTCRFLQEHRELLSRIRNVKFNLSPLDLMKEGIAEQLIGVIREHDLPTAFFQFEITETVATEYSASLERAVRAFSRAGIGLCLDDFGSGFANLNTVLRQPFHTIKLDRSLLIGICEDGKIAAFYQSIVAMFKNMGYTVIAEGVETERELERVREWGVDQIQGYYFSRPLPGPELLHLLNLE